MISHSCIAQSANSIKKPWWKTGVSVGNLSTTYTEYSGLARPNKLANREYLWGIEDGATAYILAINKNTAVLSGKWTLTGVTTSDVEDVTAASVNGVDYIYVCDTGDNANARATFKVIRVKEPTITGSDGTVSSGDIEEITCEFPAGNLPSHKDVECVLADPDTGDLYFITKRISPIKCYRLAHASSYSGTQTLEYMGDLSADSALNTLSTTYSNNNGYATAGNVSPNGSEILIRSYTNIFVWRRNKQKESIYQTLSRAPDANLTNIYVGGGGSPTLTVAPKCLHPNQEPQGEDICFDYNGLDIYTCSEYLANEGSSASSYPLFKYTRVEKEPIVVSFQQGTDSYAGCVDTFLDSTTPTISNATATSLVLDYDYSAFPTISRTRQALVKFDLSSIPSNAIIIGAYLTLYINTEGKNMYWHRVLSSWTDASTWNSLTNGIQLDNTDAISAADAYVGVSTASQGIDSYVGTIRVNMPVSTVQGWVDGTLTNYGWVGVGGVEASGDGLQIDSSKSATTSRRPKLTISYILP